MPAFCEIAKECRLGLSTKTKFWAPKEQAAFPAKTAEVAFVLWPSRIKHKLWEAARCAEAISGTVSFDSGERMRSPRILVFPGIRGLRNRPDVFFRTDRTHRGRVAYCLQRSGPLAGREMED